MNDLLLTPRWQLVLMYVLLAKYSVQDYFYYDQLVVKILVCLVSCALIAVAILTLFEPSSKDD